MVVASIFERTGKGSWAFRRVAADRRKSAMHFGI
jgi:hypothetical protein